LPVKVVVNNDWGTGYCAVVTVTNNTSGPVDWQVAFDVQGKIYTFWNAIWTQAGNKVTAGGVDWNNILKPGESTRDVGFCANK
jgi:cellulase/cellobiase CelA1